MSERDKVIVELLGELAEDDHYSDDYRKFVAYWLVNKMFKRVEPVE